MRCLPISRWGTNHSFWLLFPEGLGEFLPSSANQDTWDYLGWVLNLTGKTLSLLKVLEALPLAWLEPGFIFWQLISLQKDSPPWINQYNSAAVGGLWSLKIFSKPSHVSRKSISLCHVLTLCSASLLCLYHHWPLPTAFLLQSCPCSLRITWCCMGDCFPELGSQIHSRSPSC